MPGFFNFREIRNLILLFLTVILLSSAYGYFRGIDQNCKNYVNDCKILVIDDNADTTTINNFIDRKYIGYSNLAELLGFDTEVKFIIKKKNNLTPEELKFSNNIIVKDGIYHTEWSKNNTFYRVELNGNSDAPSVFVKKAKAKFYFGTYVYNEKYQKSVLDFLLHHFLSDLKSLLVLIDGVLLFQFLVFFSITSVAYYVIWVKFKSFFARFKIQKSMPRPEAIWIEISQTIIALFCTSLLSFRVGFMENYKFSYIYDDIFEKGILYYIFTLVFIFILADAFYYWAHRLMHHKSIYKYTHKIHHNSVRVTPFTTISVNVSELIITSTFILIVMSFLPMHRSILLIFAAVSLLKNIMIHLGHEILPKKLNNTWLSWLVTATHHEIHHMKFQQNFGIYFRFWDVWMGTEDKDYLKKYEQVTSGKPI